MVIDLAEEVGVVELNCGGCLRELSIPSAIHEAVEKARRDSDSSALGKMYDGFYVSPEAALRGDIGYYCSKSCHVLFTED